MFDAPPEEKCRLEWELDLDLDQPWKVGLVTGPSGSGKTTLMREVWGEPQPLDWTGLSVIDDFPAGLSTQEVAAVCQAVGFNTIPAWMRPYAVLSNGEKFRVELARRLIGDGDTIVMDEFTSVVDRQVAQIGAHAVQKYIRRGAKRFVAVTCHHDLVEWLQPDWVVDMSTRQFTRRLLQRRPSLACVVGRLPRAAWEMFSPYHYLTAKMHMAAKCFGLWVNGRLASFAGLLWVPISQGKEKGQVICQVSRLVTLPDWQGLGLAMVLVDALGAEHTAAGKRLRTYPAHPALISAFTKSSHWRQTKESGFGSGKGKLQMGGRPCATFEYCGAASELPRGLV
jgi:ABC-type Mn2+/Zn2+ transport system ATPase subunit